jgi:hypothetical protein
MMLWSGLLLGTVFFGLLLWVGYQRYRQQQWRNLMSLGPAPGKNSFRNYRKGRFWLRDRYSPWLPNISRYGGKRDLTVSQVIATEYPRAVDVNTEPLEQQRPCYVVREPLLSESHLALLRMLWQILRPSVYQVFPDWWLSQVVDIRKTEDGNIHEAHAQRLQNKRVDFVICDSQAKVRGIILLEPENRAEQKLKQQVEARFIESLLTNVDIPVLFLAENEKHEIKQIACLLSERFKLNLTQKSSISKPAMPACPKCGAAMKKTQAKTGQYAGQWLFVCSDYPRCRTARKCPTH